MTTCYGRRVRLIFWAEPSAVTPGCASGPLSTSGWRMVPSSVEIVPPSGPRHKYTGCGPAATGAQLN
jgi:hypothetical protein